MRKESLQCPHQGQLQHRIRSPKTGDLQMSQLLLLCLFLEWRILLKRCWGYRSAYQAEQIATLEATVTELRLEAKYAHEGALVTRDDNKPGDELQLCKLKVTVETQSDELHLCKLKQ